ncbi:uncharacterized protein TRAVEDRAFT_49325 [Trametes versicolor FP-101664 SS1]|uniref:uncharacterized protein n=1 Tax=Trametes versicolor (strain FP-101664) TaxID=717944 RepID=UPI0004624101|nr:uncharacterized protein TRAVEDRAFT_49325 [Trametes versicolor FP-101664 SS1]EIW56499.1 hypothetical protein TRAVEDRAFT_49325 [Trametes versicolor FP-101664 SS1]
MASEDSDYPWFARFPDGSINYGAIPDRLTRHPEVQRRGIVLTNTLKAGAVYRTLATIDPCYVVKILNLSTEELAIYQRLLREPKRPNSHTVPVELILDSHPLLIMPSLGELMDVHRYKQTAATLVDVIFQLVEGLEYLHSLHIVHMDMCMDNVLAANNRHEAVHGNVVDNRLYIIDFDSSRQFALGPGVQRAITLPETQIEKPNGLEHFDPYAWDMYCAGRTLEELVRLRYQEAKIEPHWLAMKYIRWLIGDERGCTGVCHCRPTAHTALRVAVILRWAVYVTDGYDWVVDTLLRLWPTRSDERERA